MKLASELQQNKPTLWKPQQNITAATSLPWQKILFTPSVSETVPFFLHKGDAWRRMYRIYIFWVLHLHQEDFPAILSVVGGRRSWTNTVFDTKLKQRSADEAEQIQFLTLSSNNDRSGNQIICTNTMDFWNETRAASSIQEKSTHTRSSALDFLYTALHVSSSSFRKKTHQSNKIPWVRKESPSKTNVVSDFLFLEVSFVFE